MIALSLWMRRLTLAALLALFAGSGVAHADTIKELVLDDCNAAKEALTHADAAERQELIPYFSQVLQLTLSGMVPIAPPGQTMPRLPSKIQDNNPLAVNHVDPLRAANEDRERNAHRCAVDLLGMEQARALPALPALIRYASQHELDDASRDVADETIISIAERAGDEIPDALLTDIVASMSGERPELGRSVLLMLAPHADQRITEEVLSNQDIPVTSRNGVVADLLALDEDATVRGILTLLNGQDTDAQIAAIAVLNTFGLKTADITLQFAPLLFSNNGEVRTLASQRIAGLYDADCVPVENSFLPKLTELLASDDVAGGAALNLLKCVRRKTKDLPVAKLKELSESNDPLTRSRAAILISAGDEPGREEFDLLKLLLVDTEVVVQRAAIHALGDLKIEKRADISALLLRYAQKFEKKNAVETIPQLTDALARQMTKLPPVSIKTGWASVAEDFFTVEAGNKGTNSISSDEKKVAVEILRSFTPDGFEIPSRLLKSGVEARRLLGVELLIAYGATFQEGPLPRQYVANLTALLDDEVETIRARALGAIVDEIERYKTGLTSALSSKNVRTRGAAALALFQLAADKSNPHPVKPISKADMQAGRDWLLQAGCEELLPMASNLLLQTSEFRSALQSRLVPCLASQKLSNSTSLSTALAVIEGDKESTALVVQAALDGKLNDATVLGIVARAVDLDLPIEQTKPLIDGVLHQNNADLTDRVLPAIAKLGPGGAGFVPQLRPLADAPDQNAALRCRLYGALSEIAPSTVEWPDFLLAEIRATAGDAGEGESTSCVGDLDSNVAQLALEDVLKTAPLHYRAAVFARITALKHSNADETLTAAIERSLAEPNQALRCQAARAAICIGLSSPGIETAVRRGLYNECWNELQSLHGALIAQAAAESVLATPRNRLEEVRAKMLQR